MELWFLRIVTGITLMLPVIFFLISAAAESGTKTLLRRVISVTSASWCLYTFLADVIFFLIFFLAGKKETVFFVEAVFWFVIVWVGAAAVGSILFIQYCLTHPNDDDVRQYGKHMGILQSYKWTMVVGAYICWGALVIVPQLPQLFLPQ